MTELLRTGRITPQEYLLAMPQALDEVMKTRFNLDPQKIESERTVKSWAAVTEAFLNSAEGADWPGGDLNRDTLGRILEANNRTEPTEWRILSTQPVGANVAERQRDRTEGELNLSGQRSLTANAAPRYGTCTIFDAGHEFKQPAGDVLRRSDAAGGVIDLARIVFGVSDELGHAFWEERPD